MPKSILALIIIVVNLAAAGEISARELDYGVRLGLNFTSFTGDDISDENKKTGIAGGFYLEKRLSPSAAFGVEFLYSQKGHIDDGSFYDTYVRTVRHIDYLELPLTLKFYPSEKMPLSIFVCGGLSPALVISDYIKYREDDESRTRNPDNLNRLDIAYVLGWGFYISSGDHRSTVELRFAQSIDSIMSDNRFLDIKNSTLSIFISSNFRKFK